MTASIPTTQNPQQVNRGNYVTLKGIGRIIKSGYAVNLFDKCFKVLKNKVEIAWEMLRVNRRRHVQIRRGGRKHEQVRQWRIRILFQIFKNSFGPKSFYGTTDTLF